MKIDGDMLVAKASYFLRNSVMKVRNDLGMDPPIKKSYGMGKILKSSEAGGVDTEL